MVHNDKTSRIMIVLQRNRSTLVLKTYINIGKIIAMCPWNERRYFGLAWITWLSLYTYSVISSTITTKWKSPGYSGHHINITDTLEVIFAFVLVASIFATSPFKRESWRKLIHLTLQENVTEKLWNYNLRDYFKVIAVHLTMLLLIYGLLSSWFGRNLGCNDLNICLLSFSYMTKWYYQFLMVNLLWELSNTLEHRYQNLQKAVESCFPLVASETSYNKNFLANVRKIKATYGDLHEAVDMMNRIFGVSMVCFLVYTTVSILNSCSWCLYYLHAENFTPGLRMRRTISSLVSPLYNLIQTVFLVMACDRVETSGRRVINACYMMQRRIDRSGLGEELIYLGKYLKYMAPKFPAAGLFNVNRKILSSLLSCTTSYIIVILQFRSDK